MGGYGLSGGAVAPGTGPAVPGTGNGQEDLEKPKKKKTGVKETMDPTRAKLLVELPTNAKLFVDDMPVNGAAGVLTLHTPPLEPDKDYFYMVRIEMLRDGQPLSETHRILVRAGQVARADFNDLQAGALKTARAK
jgi:uncharacterized protein (TIGR03000 family)